MIVDSAVVVVVVFVVVAVCCCCCCCCCRLNNKRGKQNHCTSHRRCDLPSRLRSLSITNTASLVSTIVVVLVVLLAILIAAVLHLDFCPRRRRRRSPSHDQNNVFSSISPHDVESTSWGEIEKKTKRTAVSVKKHLHWPSMRPRSSTLVAIVVASHPALLKARRIDVTVFFQRCCSSCLCCCYCWGSSCSCCCCCFSCFLLLLFFLLLC